MKNTMNIIREIAAQEGISEKECRIEIEKVIFEAWNNSDAKAQEKFDEVFNSKLPSPEEFILKIVQLLEKH